MASSSPSTEILQFVKQYSMLSGCFISAFGVTGNTINILVFTRLKLFRENRSAFFLTVESISNFYYQLISISAVILTSIYGGDVIGRSLIWCKFRSITAQMFVLTTLSMICCTAIDQYLSTNYRWIPRQVFTMKLARRLTYTFVCLWTAHSIVFGLFYDILPTVGCVLSNALFLRYATFFFYPVLSGLLPVFSASFFSLCAYRNVRRIVRRQLPIVRRRLDQQMTAMVFIRVIFFVFLVLPYICYRVYTINYPASRDKPIEYAVGQLLQALFSSFVALNYTVSFYVFMLSSSRFRRQVKFLLVKKYWKRWKQWCHCHKQQITPADGVSMHATMELEDI